MRIMRGKDYPIDLKKLSRMLKEAGIEHTLRPHPSFEAEKGCKELIGYYPAGEWQILIGDLDGRGYSIIRGYASFGDYEIYDGKDIKRTRTAREMVWLVKGLLCGKTSLKP